MEELANGHLFAPGESKQSHENELGGPGHSLSSPYTAE